MNSKDSIPLLLSSASGLNGETIDFGLVERLGQVFHLK